MNKIICKDGLIRFKNTFNSPFTNAMLEYFKNYDKIELSDNFCHSIDDLPDNIREIKFNKSYNEYVNKYPAKLEILIVNENYNRKLDNLPDGLQILNFVYFSKYNWKMDNLPESLRILNLPYEYNCENGLDNLPERMDTLIVNGYNSNINFGKLPKNLREISLDYWDNDLINLPDNLEKLFVQSGPNLKLDKLPVNLKKLEINGFNGNLDNLPIGLKMLCIGNANIPLDFLPETLEFLRIPYRYYDYDLCNLPRSLKLLQVNCHYSGYIPEWIKVERLYY